MIAGYCFISLFSHYWQNTQSHQVPILNQNRKLFEYFFKQQEQVGSGPASLALNQ